MKTREVLKDKASCYATHKVNECSTKCFFYWTCKASLRQLENGDIKCREDILNYEKKY